MTICIDHQQYYKLDYTNHSDAQNCKETVETLYVNTLQNRAPNKQYDINYDSVHYMLFYHLSTCHSFCRKQYIIYVNEKCD